jgi:IS5 family transposase
VDRLTGEVAWIAKQTVLEVQAVASNARRALGRRPDDGRLARLVDELEETGNRVMPDRLVSLSDPDARPIRKGKPHHPTQVGYTALVAEEERGSSPTIRSSRQPSGRAAAGPGGQARCRGDRPRCGHGGW